MRLLIPITLLSVFLNWWQTETPLATTCSCDRQQDSLALVALYKNTNGANWKTTWNLATPMDTWHGVKLNRAACVIGLSLKSNELNGVLPLELSKLQGLKNLELYDNQLSGEIPPELSRLEQLIKLSLGNNQLVGSIPSELGALKNLVELKLYNNQLGGEIPPELGELEQLTILKLYANQLTGSLPSELGKLRKLIHLQLYNNQLSGEIPPELGSLSKLRSFSLQNNQLSGCFPEELSSHCSINRYSFKNNPALPWQGDFGQFCRGNKQKGVPCDDGKSTTTDERIMLDCICRSPSIQADIQEMPAYFQAEKSNPFVPKLVLEKASFSSKGLAKRQEKITLKIQLKNKGTASAKNVTVQFSHPDNVEHFNTRRFELGTLSVDTVVNVAFDFFARSYYNSNKLEIKVAAWDDTKDVKLLEYLSLDLRPYNELFNRFIFPSLKNSGHGPSPIPYQSDDITIRWEAPNLYGNRKDLIALSKYQGSTISPKLYVLSTKGKLKPSDFILLLNNENAIDIGRIAKKQIELRKVISQGNTYSYLIIFHDLLLKQGENELVLQVKKTRSKKVKITFLPPKSNLHIYSIGVPSADLKYTAKDAADFFNLFQADYPNELFKTVQSTLDTAKEQTTAYAMHKRMESISNQRTYYEEIKKNDVIILFMSSHGYVDKENDEFYIVGSDYDRTAPLIRSSCLPFHIIYDEFDRIKEDCKIVFFIDTCYSGKAVEGEKDIETTKSYTDPISEALIQIAQKSSGYNTLLSCSAGEKSHEDKAWKNGAFTEVLLEAFELGDADGNTIITLNEIYNYVRTRLPELTQEIKGCSQVPYMSKAHQKQDLPLYILKKH